MSTVRTARRARWSQLVSLVAALGLVAGVTAVTGGPGQPAAAAPEKLQPELRASMRTLPVQPFWVRLEDRADLSAASAVKDWNARGAAVVEALRKTAEKSQADVVRRLKAEGVEYHTFYASNTVYVPRGTLDLAETLAKETEVSAIQVHRMYELPEPLKAQQVADVDEVEWGVHAIGADRVWADGTRGEGIVVGSIDSGVQFDHPALVKSYRGNTGEAGFSHDYNWFDPSQVCGSPSLAPCDNNQHGTHTMGTMVGDGGPGNHIGVAPGARWIAAKGCEERGCSDFALLASAEWMLAPTNLAGQDPRPDLRPHIVNNSWGTDNGAASDPWFADIVEDWRAAGIFPMFSNGNAGEGGCDTSGTPGDYASTYSAGAFDVNGKIGYFSSRGPGAGGITKPNIAAPGVDVRSSVPGGGYGVLSGTSMASPHVAGAIALLWSAAPGLIGDIAGTTAVLDQVAVDVSDTSCGGTPTNNNVWGQGKLDAYTAIAEAPRGETGQLAGKVTDAKTGEPISGAEVRISGPIHRTVTTGADGSYAATLSAGEYGVTASAYGYGDGTASATVTAGANATRDIRLQRSAEVEVSGTVTDDSGHGWPLYARINAPGLPVEPWFTDPKTGRYELTLPADSTYHLIVTPLYPGYRTSAVDVPVGEGAVVRDVRAGIDETSCLAPGYAYPLRANFEGWTDPAERAGWTVEDNLGGGHAWQFDEPGGLDNVTGGTAGFATADSWHNDLTEEDTNLVSPVVDLSGQSAPQLAFKTLYLGEGGTARVGIDLSVDGGSTWTTVWQKNTENALGPVSVPLPQAAGQARTRLRFHYAGSGIALWQVDEVTVGACGPTPGGLVTGVVRDDNTGDPVDGAKLVDKASRSELAVSAATPLDPNLPDGFYWLFSSQAKPTFTVSYPRYATGEARTTVSPDRVTTKDWRLRAGHLKVSAESLDLTTRLGKSATRTLTLTNDGTSPVHVKLGEQVVTPTGPAGQRVAEQPGAPLRRVKVDPPRTGPLPKAPAGQPVQPAELASPEDATPAVEPWVRIANYPTRILYNAAGYHAGKLYSVGGTTNGFLEGMTRGGYVYDPVTLTWSPIADSPEAVANGSGIFLDDKMYVVGGTSMQGTVLKTVYVYDPAQDSWGRAADLPQPVSDAAIAALDGRLYVVGGCFESCPAHAATVYRYDPIQDSWTRLTDYPVGVNAPGCAGVAERVVCAGGYDGDNMVASTFVFDPASGEWTRGADAPYGVFAMGASGAYDKLQLFSGLQNGSMLTNEAIEYDPVSDSWGRLPNVNLPTSDAATACGVYRVGGSVGLWNPQLSAEMLPGYDYCGGTADVPWLSVDKRELDVAPGRSVRVTVRVDGDEVTQPGDLAARLVVLTDAPYPGSNVAVTGHFEAPPNWATLSGTVTDAATGGAVGGATVTVCGDYQADGHGQQGCGPVSYTVVTDAHGRYQLRLAKNQKVQVTAAAPGFQPASTVTTVRGAKNTVNIALRTG
ncbi:MULTISPECIES: S8 family serine peptidase [unclassified Micromonospora]|uniref:S8 family serine peptidase n=1 Tax=Micromonospora sp. NPDC005087 TaxID=3364225 RepID=UPI0036B055D1